MYFKNPKSKLILQKQQKLMMIKKIVVHQTLKIKSMKNKIKKTIKFKNLTTKQKQTLKLKLFIKKINQNFN